MTAAYLCVPDDRVNFSHILSSPSDFYNATPILFGLPRFLSSSLVRAALKWIRSFAAPLRTRIEIVDVLQKQKGRRLAPASAVQPYILKT
jgi:hypothetical protein